MSLVANMEMQSFDKLPKLRQPLMPVIYARLFLDVAIERGLAPGLILRQARVSQALLNDPLGRISTHAFTQLVISVVDILGNDGLGFEVGLRQPLTAHGSLGLALMCCPTIGEAMPVLQRFWYLRGRGVGITTNLQGEYATIALHEEMPMSTSLRNVLFESILTSICRGLAAVGGDATDAELWFTWAQSAYAGRFADNLPAMHFNRSINGIRIASKMLQQPIVTASPETLHLAVAQCERELSLLGDSLDDIVNAARAAMVLGAQGYPNPGDLAESLHLSGRTMRRRLQAQGFSYKALLDDVRQRDAMMLLDNPSLSIQAIAEWLGFQNPANFTRAFRGWTSKTPSEYRRLRGRD